MLVSCKYQIVIKLLTQLTGYIFPAVGKTLSGFKVFLVSAMIYQYGNVTACLFHLLINL